MKSTDKLKSKGELRVEEIFTTRKQASTLKKFLYQATLLGMSVSSVMAYLYYNDDEENPVSFNEKSLTLLNLFGGSYFTGQLFAPMFTKVIESGSKALFPKYFVDGEIIKQCELMREAYEELKDDLDPLTYDTIEEKISSAMHCALQGDSYAETELKRAKPLLKVSGRPLELDITKEKIAALDNLIAPYPQETRKKLRRVIKGIMTSIKENEKAPAISLIGPPGVGKTYLIGKIAEIIGIPNISFCFPALSYEDLYGRGTLNQSNLSILLKARQEAGKYNTKHVMIIFDEIDKTSKTHKNFSTQIAWLHEHLDPNADKFTEAQLGCELDSKGIIYVTAGNQRVLKDDSFLERIIEVEFEDLEPESKTRLAEIIFNKLFAKAKLDADLPEHKAFLKKLLDLDKQSGVRIIESVIKDYIRYLKEDPLLREWGQDDGEDTYYNVSESYDHIATKIGIVEDDFENASVEEEGKEKEPALEHKPKGLLLDFNREKSKTPAKDKPTHRRAISLG